MPRAKTLPIIMVLIVAAVFIYGIFELMMLRFQAGDIYPPYSTLRADPLGSKALYEGMLLMPGIKTTRNIEPLSKITGLAQTGIFFLGLQPGELTGMDKADATILDAAARKGARIIITFYPHQKEAAKAEDETEEEVETGQDTDQKAAPAPASKGGTDKNRQGTKGQDIKDQAKKDQDRKTGPEREEQTNLAERWGVDFELAQKKPKQADLIAAEPGLSKTLAWHSALFFTVNDKTWRTIYRCDAFPVLIERAYGKGSIVLAADSYFTSNEAMKAERHPDLLLWLTGKKPRIIFDETHLGVAMQAGVASLLRSYGLGPFFISLVALALLAVWRQSASFLPPAEEGQTTKADPLKDYTTGLTNLFSRNIAPEDVLDACLEEWKRSFTHGGQNLSALLPAIEAIIAADKAKPAKLRDPIKAYRDIHALIYRGKERRRIQGIRHGRNE